MTDLLETKPAPTKKSTLDARIAAALKDNDASKEMLSALVTEAECALATATETMRVEGERAADIANDDPDEALAKVRKAELTVTRLNKALPLLRQRLEQVVARDYFHQWHAALDDLEGERDKLAAELKRLYPKFVKQLLDLFGRMDAVDQRIGHFHRNAPSGEPRRLAGVEQLARGLDRFDAANPPLREKLKLPDWGDTREMAFPPDATAEWNRRAVALAQPMIQEMARKGALAADWEAARRFEAAQANAEDERLDALQAQKRADEKRKFEKAVADNDRKARGVL